MIQSKYLSQKHSQASLLAGCSARDSLRCNPFSPYIPLSQQEFPRSEFRYLQLEGASPLSGVLHAEHYFCCKEQSFKFLELIYCSFWQHQTFSNSLSVLLVGPPTVQEHCYLFLHSCHGKNLKVSPKTRYGDLLKHSAMASTSLTPSAYSITKTMFTDLQIILGSN